ncbi:MAG TPA: prephenate dehydrogenase/arogenate dehydrogenase family protein [Pirellulaceae bacterium]|nr:prephenate dehydrogenase/arogenate dehydrogenase family protein [Pirellulaceae bacterium]
MRAWDTVAIIGVGLIGGSIGLALRERKLARRVIGIGRRKESLEKAKARGCVSQTTTSIADGVKQADLVVVCTPVDSIAQHVQEAGKHFPAGSLITDAGSTKAEIVVKAETALANRFPAHMPFVGSHPLAGSEQSGPEAATAELFAGRVVVVTETDISDHDVVDTIEEFWQSLGARVIRMSPDDHDAALAYTSHLPHLIASTLAAATPEDHLPLTATGWQDTTRIAAGDVELWRQIFLANAPSTLKALADFETVLARFRTALETSDGSLLAEILAEGKRRRDAVGS